MNKVVFSDADSNSNKISVKISAFKAEGPDRDGDFRVTIEYLVTNHSDKPITYLATSSQVYNANGNIVANTTDEYPDESIEPGESKDFESSFWSLSAKLLEDSPEKSQALIHVIACVADRVTIHEAPLGEEVLVTHPINIKGLPGEIEVLSATVWQTAPNDDKDIDVEVRYAVHNKTAEFFPCVRVLMEVTGKKGECLDTGESYEPLNPIGTTVVAVTCRIGSKKIKGSTVKIDTELFKVMGSTHDISGSLKITASDDDNDDSDGFGDGKRIYIKTEPAGRIVFGRLSDEDAARLEEAAKSQEMPEYLLDIRNNINGDILEHEGVFNSGDDGSEGNEGRIEYDGCIEIPMNKHGQYEDGAYLAYLSLTKASIEFEFEPNDGEFEIDKFVEVSVPVNLPDFVNHDLYGPPNYNIVIDYKYDDELIDEYDHELVDRGYDDLICFFIVKAGKPKLIYKNYNGNEEWA